MVNMTNDILNYKSLIDFTTEFIRSRDYLKTLKLTHKKHLIGNIMPNVELICAAGAYPVFPIRMKHFGNSSLSMGLDFAKTLLGNKLFTGLIQSAGKFDKSNTVENIVQDLYDGIFKQYAEMFEIGVEQMGIPADECYGIKIISGMYKEKGKNLSATFHQSIRCSAWQKAYETWGKYASPIFIDIPPYSSPEAIKLAREEVLYASEKISAITGKIITENGLRKWAIITNECKNYSERIINVALGDKYPINPVTMSQMLSLIEICFQDYMSDPRRFRDILKNICEEFEQGARSKNAIDVKHLKKVFLTVRFGGWEPEIEKHVFENGGRVIYADWFLFGFMERIKTTGDMFENYAEYLRNIVIKFGCNNKEIVKNTMDFVLNNDIDAVVYNQLFGCHSVTTAYTRLRKQLIREEIPSTLVSFNNIGENVEQTKTRVVALMELLK